MNLLIISHMGHYRDSDGIIKGWGPTVQEIDVLATLFDRVRHLTWFHEGLCPASNLAYTATNVDCIFVPPSGGETLKSKLSILNHTFDYVTNIFREMAIADVVHIRAPANISMMAMIALAFVREPKFRWVKYAGNWQPEARDAISNAFQRWWLRKGMHRGIVTINGKWPVQAPHLHSFHNPSLHGLELEKAKAISVKKQLTVPCSLLYVGYLASTKGVDRLLQIALELKKLSVPFTLNIVGDGPTRAAYEAWCRDNGLDDYVKFHGWQPRTSLDRYYADAHVFLMPTDSEGWPKVLSEAMAYGVVPIASAVSSIPQVLSETGAGITVPSTSIDRFVGAVNDLIASPARWKIYSNAGIQAAALFSYEHYLSQVQKLFQDAWGLRLDETKRTNQRKRIKPIV